MLARAGVRVTVLEAQPTIGGGLRSAELTLPGFTHDVCSAVHPLAVSSPIFRRFPLHEHGLEWVYPLEPAAHPLDGGGCGTIADIDVPLWQRWHELADDLLAPPRWPKDPRLFARFAARAAWPATVTANVALRNMRARAVFAGMAAHSVLPLDAFGSAAFGWVLTISAKAVGWPLARGGSQSIANALVSYLNSLGGEVTANQRIDSFRELEPGATVLCDISPKELARIGAVRLPSHYLNKLVQFRYGPGVFKIDWALKAPIPWTNPVCARAATVHIGGTLEEIAASERAPWCGEHHPAPFVLLAQPTLFDPTRAPVGMHTAWAYCHVPNGSTRDMTKEIESQIERFAPGFRETILARTTMNTAEMQRHNANLVGGDIGGGAADIRQLFARPSIGQYLTPARGIFLCSASTPPGGGVHGMCGYHAARWALMDED
ncbi:MAG: NAD(P)/FAD-dependent oxidoreductase [Acidobacteriota bacterium]|nr:NAD(P)/FAD-dependent oxidoreductase [Acidobacteriota bacterium]